MQWSVSSPMNHWYLNSAYSLKKREKKVNKQAKLYSTTMYTAPRVKERAGAMMTWWRERAWNRDSSETRVLLGTETWAIAVHRKSLEEERKEEEEEETLHQKKRKQKWRQRHREEEHGYKRTDVGAIFSYRLEAEWRKSQRFHCHTDFPLGPSRAISFLLTATLLLLLFHLIPLFLPCTVNLIFLRL